MNAALRWIRTGSRPWLAAHVAAIALTLVGIWPATAHVQAVTTSWNTNLGGSFTDPAKWINGVPMSADTAVFDRNANVQYNVTFPGKINLPLPVYAFDQLRVGTNAVSFADFTNFGQWAAGSVTVNNAATNEADRGIIIGDVAGQTAVLNTTLKTFSGVAATVGNAAGATGTLNVSAGTLNITGSSLADAVLYIGLSGAGTLNVANGAKVNHSSAGGNAVLGYNASSSGAATVSGAGSAWTSSSTVNVGDSGTGTLNITNGGQVSNVKSTLGNKVGSIGTATVEGANSTWSTSSDLTVGFGGQGVLNVHNGGHVSTVYGFVGGHTGSNCTATVDGAGSTWTSGSLNVGPIGTGRLDIRGGGTVVSNSTGLIGDSRFSNGTVNVQGSGSTLTTDESLAIGGHGSGTLTIQNGGRVMSGSAFIGNFADGMGTVAVDGAGSAWIISEELTVGNEGLAQLNITNGGQVTSAGGFVGRFNTVEIGDVRVASIDGPGSTWTNTGDLTVGGIVGTVGGNGTIVVSNGGAVSVSGVLHVASQGIIKGNGNISADIFNAGMVAPGISPGALHVDGAYIQAAAGKLQIELGGVTPGASYDQLLVSGAASLNGALQASLINGFMPEIGNTFEILSGVGGVSGQFTTLASELPVLAGGRRWLIDYNPTSVVLEVISAPTIAADFDEDGDVDGADLTKWRTGFGTSASASHMQGDADGDLDVDGGDFLVWQRQLGNPTAVAGAAAIPEPGTLALASLAVCALASLCRRQR